MIATDYPHQRTGAAFLAERRVALLADEPGTGKTRTTIKAADLIGARRILVACPGAVREHWAVEFEKWSTVPRSVDVIGGFVRSPLGDGVTIVSHATLSDAPSMRKAARPGRGASIVNLLAGAPYDLIVVDEAAEFRQFQAQRTRTLFSGDGLASRTARLWCLSGAPFVNSAADLYPLVFGAIGSRVSWEEFCGHYCTMVPDAYVGMKPVGLRNAAELADGLRPVRPAAHDRFARDRAAAACGGARAARGHGSRRGPGGHGGPRGLDAREARRRARAAG